MGRAATARDRRARRLPPARGEREARSDTPSAALRGRVGHCRGDRLRLVRRRLA